jgi:hypothetical protein
MLYSLAIPFICEVNIYIVCSGCRSKTMVLLFSLKNLPLNMTYHQFFNVFPMSSTSGTEIAYPSRSPEFIKIQNYSGVCVCPTISFCCGVLYIIVVPFRLAIVLSVLRFKTSDYSFGIIKTTGQCNCQCTCCLKDTQSG